MIEPRQWHPHWNADRRLNVTKATHPGADNPYEKAKEGAQSPNPKAATKHSDPDVRKRAKAHADKATNEDG